MNIVRALYWLEGPGFPVFAIAVTLIATLLIGATS